MTNLFTTMRALGFPMKKASQIIYSIPREDDLIQWNDQMRWKAFRFHFHNNEKYRNYVGKTPRKWEEIPILRKQDFFNANISLKPEKNKFKRYYKQSTSGSSGIPFIFYSDYLTHALIWAQIDKFYKQANAPLNGLQARFYGTPSAFFEKLKERAKDLLARRERFQVINLSEKDMKEWLLKMKRREFTYLYGYAFPLIAFAKYLITRKTILKESVPSLKSCIVTSEMCTAEEQKLMERAFGVKVYNEYGSSEVGIIGFGDTGKWKISNELLHIEIVDELGQPVEDGKVGRVICTQLYQQGTPFIRYDVGDLAAIKTIEGKRYITELQGRKEAVLKLPSGKSVPGDTLFHFVIREFHRKYPNIINQFQAIQKNDSSLEIRIVSTHPLSEKEKRVLLKIINKYTNEEINTEIRVVTEIPMEGRAKRQRFISNAQHL